eukprot:49649_1
MEQWVSNMVSSAINERQKKASAGGVGKDEQTMRTALDRVGLSRPSLKSLLSDENVDRLYCSLFVYTAGLYDIVTALTKHCIRADKIVQKSWITYTRMIERTEPGQYSHALRVVVAQNEHNSVRFAEQLALSIRTARTEKVEWAAEMERLKEEIGRLSEKLTEESAELVDSKGKLNREEAECSQHLQVKNQLESALEEWRFSLNENKEIKDVFKEEISELSNRRNVTQRNVKMYREDVLKANGTVIMLDKMVKTADTQR